MVIKMVKKRKVGRKKARVRTFYGRYGYTLAGKFMDKGVVNSRKKRMRKNNYVKTEKVPKKTKDYRNGYRYYIWKVPK